MRKDLPPMPEPFTTSQNLFGDEVGHFSETQMRNYALEVVKQRDAEIAQLKAVTKPLAEALREMLRFPPASVFVSACDALNSYDEANK